MKKFILLIFLFMLIIAGSLFITVNFITRDSIFEESVLFPAPSVLGSVTDEMKSPGFWIGLHPSPDSVIMDINDIEKFNQALIKEGKTFDIFKVPPQRDAHSFSGRLKESINSYLEKNFFFIDSSKIADSFFFDIESNIIAYSNRDSIFETKYAVVSAYTHQRVLPTLKTFHEKVNDPDFDYNMVNSLDIGETVAVLYNTNDNKWAYTASNLSYGWILKESLAFFDKKEVEIYENSKDYIYTISPKSDLYSNSSLTDFHSSVRMGVKLPLVKYHNKLDVYEVAIPVKHKDSSFFTNAFIESEFVTEKEMPLTARNIYKLAFRGLNKPYGWGGMYMEQDCSRYIWQIFSPFGFVLPRNSGFQNNSGIDIFTFDSTHTDSIKKELIIQHAHPGLTVLGMRGHIMLYLGQIEDQPYAIHSVWAYRTASEFPEEIMVINRTAVTDLDLGKGSQRGSLISRISGIRNFTID